MSRMRQIPIMDVRQQERMLQQNQSAGTNPGGAYTPMCHPPVCNSVRPVPTGCKSRGRRPSAAKFRLSDTPALISTGCSSMRQFCNNVQNITVDLNHLIGSVESMLPLLNTYLSALQNRNASQEMSLEPPIEVTAQSPVTKAVPPQHAASAAAQKPSPETMPPANGAVSMPRPEDIQALLENPLVHNLLNGFMQNSAFSNVTATKENTLHS